MSAIARTAYDSITASDIPTTARIVIGYANGLYEWSAADWARFPDATKVRYSVKGLVPCDGYDVEQGDYSPSDAPQLLSIAHSAGITRPTLYFSRSLYTAVRLYVDTPGTDWAWHCADWTGSPHPVAESDGGEASLVQYATPTIGPSGGHYDLSAVYDDAWPIYVPPQPRKEDDMPPFWSKDPQGQGQYIVAADLSHKKGVPDLADFQALQALGYERCDLSEALFAAIPSV